MVVLSSDPSRERKRRICISHIPLDCFNFESYWIRTVGSICFMLPVHLCGWIPLVACQITWTNGLLWEATLVVLRKSGWISTNKDSEISEGPHHFFHPSKRLTADFDHVYQLVSLLLAFTSRISPSSSNAFLPSEFSIVWLNEQNILKNAFELLLFPLVMENFLTILIIKIMNRYSVQKLVKFRVIFQEPAWSSDCFLHICSHSYKQFFSCNTKSELCSSLVHNL